MFDVRGRGWSRLGLMVPGCLPWLPAIPLPSSHIVLCCVFCKAEDYERSGAAGWRQRERDARIQDISTATSPFTHNKIYIKETLLPNGTYLTPLHFLSLLLLSFYHPSRFTTGRDESTVFSHAERVDAYSWGCRSERRGIFLIPIHQKHNHLF